MMKIKSKQDEVVREGEEEKKRGLWLWSGSVWVVVRETSHPRVSRM